MKIILVAHDVCYKEYMNGLKNPFWKNMGVITTPFYSGGNRKVTRRSTIDLVREFDHDQDELAVLSGMSLNWRPNGTPPPYEEQAIRLASKRQIPYGFITNSWSEMHSEQWFTSYLVHSRVLILPKIREAELDRIQHFLKRTRLVVGDNEPQMVAKYLFSAFFCQS